MELSDDTDLTRLGTELHQRLLGGDVTAPAEIAEAFLFLVTKSLQRRYPNLYDPHLIDEAADRALLSYFENPTRYAPSLRSLGGYLIMSADGDLLNLLRRERNLGPSENSQIVELDEPTREYEVGQETDSLTVEEQVFILASPVWSMLERLLPNPTDRKIAHLMLEGVRGTTDYAHVMGIEHLAKTEQEEEVKRQKDRIKRTLQRHIDRSQLSAK